MNAAEERVAVFVDVQNIYYTTRQAFGQQFNYFAFWDEVSKNRDMVAAMAFAIEPANGKQKGFQQILKDIGFDVKLKPYIQRSDGSAKADWDVGITLELIDFAPQVDKIILASGDGDFDLAVQRINDRFDVETIVYGVEPLTAGSLIESANLFRPIDDDLLLPKAGQ